MVNLIEIYRNNYKIKFYTDFIVVFFCLSFLLGGLLTQSISFVSEDYRQLSFFLRRLFLWIFFIFSFALIYFDAGMVGVFFQKKVKLFLVIYGGCSFFITCVFECMPFTVFSYMGFALFSYMSEAFVCDSLCEMFHVLIFGTYSFNI
ncbi:MAG: hypothetical protein KHX61_07040 [Proteobacteria bacterium]|jgi:hypothetical protein|nr:hypothetical protein [Pseudomonadota bacterium]